MTVYIIVCENNWNHKSTVSAVFDNTEAAEAYIAESEKENEHVLKKHSSTFTILPFIVHSSVNDLK